MSPGESGALLQDGLIWDPRLLLDARLLEVLHGELRERMGLTDARSALLCAGFVQGYRDGSRATGVLGMPSAPLLPIDARVSAARDCVAGGWPSREAAAVLASQGAHSEPACALSSGYASGWLTALSGEDVLATEVRCAASGDVACRFEARPVSKLTTCEQEPAVRAALDALPFAALRAEVERKETLTEAGPAFDSTTAAVHVWGPVMVVPYSGGDTATTVEAVVRDGAGEPISVVVVDVAGAILDDGFGAAALEQTVQTIQAGGAEAVIAGVSAESQRLLGRLSNDSCSLHRELPEAIAAAFRIAESQRHST